MSRIYYCKRCGAKLMDQPGSPCPRCLLGAAMQPDPAPAEPMGPAGAPSPMDAPATIASPAPGKQDGSELPTAAELGPYFPQLEILDLLGRGGMGAVYKARHRGLDRLVAVKILPPSTGQAPGFAERFTREARALARLSHPGIVAVYDFGHVQGLYYFIMEYVDGADLRRLIRAGKMTPKDALGIVPQICDALQYAHDAGVIHRDIKPENILLDAKGQVKIADFGLAKLFGQATPDYTLTAAECSMGTPRYMAPEQMDNPKSVDHRADIYSLGVVFYEMLTGEVPAGRFAVPSQRSKSDARLDPVVLRSLEREPGLRYQKVSDVKSAVATACSAPPLPRMPPPLPPTPARAGLVPRRRKRKRVLVVFLLLVAIGVTVVIVSIKSGGGPREQFASLGDDRITALIRAVEEGNTEQVRQLEWSLTDVNARDPAGDTGLTKAAALGRIGPARELLSRADPDSRSAAGETPLALAAANGYTDLVELLCQHNAQVNARGNSRGQSALLLAAANGRSSTVEYLLKLDQRSKGFVDYNREPDPNLRDDDGLSPLVYAEARGWPEIAGLLRAHGATEDPNCSFTEAYINALDGKPADAIPQIEKLLTLGILEFQKPWHIVSKEWTYTVPQPRLALSLILVECYNRSGQASKAKSILADTITNFGNGGLPLYRRTRQADQNTLEQESYSLIPGALAAWAGDMSTEPAVSVVTDTSMESQPRDSKTGSGGMVRGIIH